MTWMPQEGMKVEINGMGPGTIMKVTPTGVMVFVDKFRLQVELQLEAMRPLPTAEGVPTGESRTAAEKDDTLDIINELIGVTGNHHEANAVQSSGHQLWSVEPYQPSEPQNQNTQQDPQANVRRLLQNRSQLPFRMLLESLRFGLVPHGQIEQMTIGFLDMKKWAVASFPEQGLPRLHKVVGQYGTGKSHTMAVIRYLAEQSGYLVGKVEVDGRLISLSEPAKLIHASWTSLKGRDFETDTPLLDLYEKAIKNGYTSHSFSSLHLTQYRDNMATIQLLSRMGYTAPFQDLIEAVLNGSDEYTATEVNSRLSKEPNLFQSQMKLTPPVSRTVSQRPDTFIESLVSCAHLAKFAGFKGLVITVDEFEVEINLPRSKFNQLIDLLQRMGQYIAGRSRWPSSPLAIYFGTVGQEDNQAEEILDQWVAETKGSVFQLVPWERAQCLELAKRIYTLYQMTYKINKPYSEKLAESVYHLMEQRGFNDSGLLRQFIKWYVTFLDMLYGPPEAGSDEQEQMAKGL